MLAEKLGKPVKVDRKRRGSVVVRRRRQGRRKRAQGAAARVDGRFGKDKTVRVARGVKLHRKRAGLALHKGAVNSHRADAVARRERAVHHKRSERRLAAGLPLAVKRDLSEVVGAVARKRRTFVNRHREDVGPAVVGKLSARKPHRDRRRRKARRTRRPRRTSPIRPPRPAGRS